MTEAPIFYSFKWKMWINTYQRKFVFHNLHQCMKTGNDKCMNLYYNLARIHPNYKWYRLKNIDSVKGNRSAKVLLLSWRFLQVIDAPWTSKPSFFLRLPWLSIECSCSSIEYWALVPSCSSSLIVMEDVTCYACSTWFCKNLPRLHNSRRLNFESCVFDQ